MLQKACCQATTLLLHLPFVLLESYSVCRMVKIDICTLMQDFCCTYLPFCKAPFKKLKRALNRQSSVLMHLPYMCLEKG